jgi:tetratricopeptide (TPR) repeat protein
LEKEPTDVQAIEGLANLYFWTRRWDDAIIYGLKMYELKIGNKVNYLLGKSYYEKENCAQAFRYLDAAYKEEPKNAELPFLFARSFVAMSNYKMAVKYYLEAIALDSSKVNGFMNWQWLFQFRTIKLQFVTLDHSKKVDND